MFVEEWAAANGFKVHNEGITKWRREHMSNLVNAFDFDNVSPLPSFPIVSSFPANTTCS